MDSKNFLRPKMVAVLGAGKFGTAVANLMAPNVGQVLLYTNNAERAFASQISRRSADQSLAANVVVTDDLVTVLRSCSIVFPVVPAANFRGLMQKIASELTLEHICIHGTKGLDLAKCKEDALLTRRHMATMSEVIMQETIVQHIGCLAGPNLAGDLVKKQPATTVVASVSEKVLSIGKHLLANSWFRVYTSSSLLSVELCGVLKNIFAIGAGLLRGSGYGDNTYAFFLTLAISEMHYIMAKMGVDTSVLFGPAGVGDLVATCGSTSSRNYTIGCRLAKGAKLSEVLADAKEVSEGVQTVRTIHQLMRSYGARTPITATIYRILFEQLPLKKGIDYLMRYPAEGTLTLQKQ